MQKRIVIPFCIFLLLIMLSGYYIYSKYTFQVDAKKELLISYASNIKTQINSIGTLVSELPLVVKPIVNERGLQNKDLNLFSENISFLKQFYITNDYFVEGISVYDRYGNVFNIYREKDGKFIEDRYRSRSINVLRSGNDVIAEKNSFHLMLPIYDADTLAGNISLKLNVESLQKELFKPYLEKGNVFPSSVIDKNSFFNFPLENEITLTQEKTILQNMEEKGSGFVIGEVTGDKISVTALSYYERLPISGHFFGVVLSYDITLVLTSSLWEFAICCLVFFILTIIGIIVLRKMTIRYQTERIKKDEIIMQMQSIYRSAPVGILVNKQNKLFAANECALRLLDGYVSRNDIGKELEKITFPPGFNGDSEQEEFQEWMLCTFEHNGQDKCFCKKQVFTEIDKVKYTIDAFWDITDMEHSRKNAIRSEIAKSELLSRISRDFKKPLDNIEDAVVLLMQKYPEDSNVTHINDEAVALSDLIDNVQDFADIEAGRIIPDEIPFNIVDELKKITDSYQEEARQKGISLHAHIASSTIRKVVGDPQRFSQVLDQLLSNAIKYTKEGEIRVSLETVSLQDGKALIKCSIEDTGQGMSKKKLKNLFSIDLRAKEEGESIGLGIIVAKKLISMMGGTIRVTSPSPIATKPDAPGVQVSFTIQFYSDQQADKHLNFSSVTSCSQIGVLVITSKTRNVQHLTNFLNRKGIHADIFTYSDASSELLINKLIIDKKRYHIVIIATENETNFDIATKIQEKKLTQQCLFIMIDTYEQKGNYLKARALQVDYYFKKDDDLSDFDLILKENFINLLEINNITSEDLRKDIRILVAENNVLSQAVATVVFKKLGYTIDFAQNALDLVNQMNHHTYDIIFMDLKFPPSDGFEIATILRQKTYTLPIVAMTSTLTKDNLKNIADSGMNGFVPKPLNPDNIRDTLLKWFV